ncbi:MAG: hypothetical protein ACJ786_18070 [Catenulispora sp.]
MSPAERAALLRHGVRYGTIQHLEAAGYDTLATIAKATEQTLAALPGIGTLGAQQVLCGLGSLMDAELARTRSAQG